MRNLLQSKIAAWCALCLIVVIILVTFKLRPVWWCFIDEFFAFMMVFCQLAAVYIYPSNYYAGKKLQLIAAIFCCLMILAIAGEFIALQFVELK